MNTILKRLACTNTRSLQIGLALYALLWGGWLILYPNSFSVASSFRVLNVWGGEMFWGTLLILLGISKSLALKLGKLIYRKIVAAFAFIAYGTIMLSFFLSGALSTGIPAFLSQTILSAWVLLALFSEDYCEDKAWNY